MTKNIEQLLPEYEMLDDMSITKVTGLLNEIAKSLNSDYNSITSNGYVKDKSKIEDLKKDCALIEEIIKQYFYSRFGIETRNYDAILSNLQAENSRIAKNKKRLKVIGILSGIIFIAFQMFSGLPIVVNLIGAISSFYGISLITTSPKYIKNPETIRDVFFNLTRDEHNNINYFLSCDLKQIEALIDAYKSFIDLKTKIDNSKIAPPTGQGQTRSKPRISPSPQLGIAKTSVGRQP